MKSATHALDGMPRVLSSRSNTLSPSLRRRLLALDDGSKKALLAMGMPKRAFERGVELSTRSKTTTGRTSARRSQSCKVFFAEALSTGADKNNADELLSRLLDAMGWVDDRGDDPRNGASDNGPARCGSMKPRSQAGVACVRLTTTPHVARRKWITSGSTACFPTPRRIRTL